jgi:hypothetical protein
VSRYVNIDRRRKIVQGRRSCLWESSLKAFRRVCGTLAPDIGLETLLAFLLSIKILFFSRLLSLETCVMLRIGPEGDAGTLLQSLKRDTVRGAPLQYTALYLIRSECFSLASGSVLWRILAATPSQDSTCSLIRPFLDHSVHGHSSHHSRAIDLLRPAPRPYLPISVLTAVPTHCDLVQGPRSCDLPLASGNRC